jgi:transposase
VAKNFIPCDRNQPMLMPSDLRDWLPPDHLVWFVIDAVARIDLSAFYARYRDDGWGRAAYDPHMVVTLLLYAYAIGVRSAREIERRSLQDVAFRIITANHRMDHATICRFRTRYRGPLSELFVSVLGLCADAGVVHPTVVAIDGTKLAANASATRNLTRDQLEDFARQVFDDAERIDAQEDELYGDKRGDEIPEHLVDQGARIEWLSQKLAEQQAAAAARTKKSTRKARINTTDPDSAPQKTPQGYVQGYNGQLAVTEDQVIVAADVTADNGDVAQLEPMITQAQDNLRATTQETIDTVVADAGYFSNDNAVLDAGVRVLVAPVATKRLDDAVANRTPPIAIDPAAEARWERAFAAAQRRAERRADVMGAYALRQVTSAEAAAALGITKERVRQLMSEWRKFGYLKTARFPVPPPRPSPADVMLERFAQPSAQQTYRLRARTVEPVIGQLKQARGLRRFLHRGREACGCEFRMMATGHNLRKLWVRGLPISRFFGPASRGETLPAL